MKGFLHLHEAADAEHEGAFCTFLLSPELQKGRRENRVKIRESRVYVCFLHYYYEDRLSVISRTVFERE